jgi:hypothetical protein
VYICFQATEQGRGGWVEWFLRVETIYGSLRAGSCYIYIRAWTEIPPIFYEEKNRKPTAQSTPHKGRSTSTPDTGRVQAVVIIFLKYYTINDFVH